MGIVSLITGRPGSSGFGSASTAEQVTDGIDASNLTAIITGGARGIGLETARVLALRKAHVIIAARNMEAASEAKQLILKEDDTARVDILKLDLSSIASIKDFAHNFIALNLPLNILINNAGIMFCPYQISEDGIEMQFATNHIGHFLLTNLLLDTMKRTAKETGIEGRIVNLSSIAHQYTYKGGIRFQMINDRASYSDKKAYGQSKLANILHANELSRRLQEEGVNITANSVHPGLIMTNLFKYSAVVMRILKIFSFFLWKNVPQGAATTCYVALHPNLKRVTGKYFLDCNEMPPSALARDETSIKESSQEESSFSNKPRARTTQADPATTTAAKTGGTSKSILDLVNRCAGKQRISPGRSNGTLTVTDASPAAPSHSFENEDEGDIDQTNVTSGQNDATATATVRRAVHLAA